MDSLLVHCANRLYPLQPDSREHQRYRRDNEPILPDQHCCLQPLRKQPNHQYPQVSICKLLFIFCSSPESSTWSSSSCWPARTAALKNGSRLRFMWLFRASTALLRPTLKNSSSLQRSSLCWSVRMRISLSESLQASLQLSRPPAPPRSQQTPSSPTGPERGMNTGNNRASSRQHDSVLSGPQRYWGL